VINFKNLFNLGTPFSLGVEALTFDRNVPIKERGGGWVNPAYNRSFDRLSRLQDPNDIGHQFRVGNVENNSWTFFW